MAKKAKKYHPFITAGHDLFKSSKVILLCPENKTDLFTQDRVKLAELWEVNYFCEENANWIVCFCGLANALI